MAKQKPVTEKKQKGPKAPLDVLLYPHLAEKSMGMVDMQNKIVFVVDPRTDKKQIKTAVESLFSVKVSSVSTEITPSGQKRAYIKLHQNYSAADIASRLGVM
ncbi:MAG: 50S ribosomal protein L23 [Candidatus Aenigmarchaeota archaeon]|nr:50S ribosomal protein L23 [Candidatus Aenigmarchaeota archaeon]